MPLYKWVRDDVGKYSFVKKVKFINAIFYIFYEYKGKLKYKKLPFRANKNQLINVIDSIKEEIGYESTKQTEELNEDKGFCFTN